MTDESVKRTWAVPPGLAARLAAYCSRTGISQVFVVRRALAEYLDREEAFLDVQGK